MRVHLDPRWEMQRDEEAGELGKPFTQLAGFGDGDGDEEEWAGWVDWESLGSSA